MFRERALAMLSGGEKDEAQPFGIIQPSHSFETRTGLSSLLVIVDGFDASASGVLQSDTPRNACTMLSIRSRCKD